jgi:hypothetical protein
VKKPVPVAQVWVLVGTGMGTAKNTHGIPVHFTMYASLVDCDSCHSPSTSPQLSSIASTSYSSSLSMRVAGGCRSLARDGIGMRKGQLDHGEDWVEMAEVGGESEAVCAMANTGFDNKGA